MNTRECYLCHRIGSAAFVPYGDSAWRCSRDDLCLTRRRAATAAARAETASFAELIEASSLGTPAAKRHRRRTERELGIEGQQRRINEARTYEDARRKGANE